MGENDKVFREKLVEQKKRTIVTRKEKLQVQQKLIEQLNKERICLDEIASVKEEVKDKENEIKNLKTEIEQLKKKHDIISKRYNALSNSKLGKITLKYWKVKGGRK